MNTIKTETHLLLVDKTAEIKDYALGNYVYFTLSDEILKIGEDALDCDLESVEESLNSNKKNDYVFKIIAASPKLGDVPEFKQ